MNPFLEEFREYSTEFLLERRALGQEAFSELAAEAVEQVLIERGVSLPPLPKEPIFVRDISKRSGSNRNYVWNIVLFLGLWILIGTVTELAKTTLIGVFVTASLLFYLFIDWIRINRLTNEERRNEENEKAKHEFGLTDLMVASAEGNLQRVKELLAYGALVDETSNVGSTALMYAIKNDHINVVKILLAAGADVNIRTKKGNIAKDLALKEGYIDIISLLDEASSRKV